MSVTTTDHTAHTTHGLTGGSADRAPESNGMSLSDPVPQYWLSPHVYVCRHGGGVILLDLKNDRFYGLTVDHSAALRPVVAGWPSEGGSNQGVVSVGDSIQAANSLAEVGMLTTSKASGKPVQIAKLTDASSLCALKGSTAAKRPITSRDVANFILACGSAALSLRLLHFDHVVAQAQRKPPTEAVVFDPIEADQLVGIFTTLRSLAFSARGRCLFHALALTRFLSRYGIYPSWVIGVKPSPFQAHSWVQHDHYVLDATPEEVCFFTPILVV